MADFVTKTLKANSSRVLVGTAACACQKIEAMFERAFRYYGTVIPLIRFVLLFVGVTTLKICGQESDIYHVGDSIENFRTGTVLHDGGVIRAITRHSVVIQKGSTLSSIPLRELSPETQSRFHYDSTNDDEGQSTAPSRQQVAARPASVAQLSQMDALLQSFSAPIELLPVVDLRARYSQLDLAVKNQGRRPSCSVFAIVSALEFQNASARGAAEKLSEEYLIWATRELFPRARALQVDQEDTDDGFSLEEVATALRTYGIPLQSQMPNTFGRSMEKVMPPETEVINEAKNRQHISIHLVPGREPETKIGNIARALNAGIPVSIALHWPQYRTVKSGYLSEQKPLSGIAHAVTVVGYDNPRGRLEECTFPFKNSYGVDWGIGGYGRVTYGYLQNNLLDAVILEVDAVN